VVKLSSKRVSFFWSTKIFSLILGDQKTIAGNPEPGSAQLDSESLAEGTQVDIRGMI
jgi:hypothetical protein